MCDSLSSPLAAEVEALKAELIKQDNELEMEKMRRIESERKLSAALAQIYRLRADRKVFRWSRLAMKLELRSLNGKQKKQIDDLRTHNELLVKVVQNVRAQAKPAPDSNENPQEGGKQEEKEKQEELEKQ